MSYCKAWTVNTMRRVTCSVTVVRDKRLLTKEEEPMSQLRLVQRSPDSMPSSTPTKLGSVKCKMLRAASLNSLPSVARKSARLHALNPGAAAVIERLVDDLLAEVS
jgi:hypothetical protein